MSIFHTKEFIALNALPVVRRDGVAFLPGPQRGTYGGFDAVRDLKTMQEMVAESNCTSVKLAPASHDLQLFSLSMHVLHQAGFLVDYVDLNYERCPRNADFAEGISDGARKKLAKCKRAGFQSRMLEREEWSKAYRLIADNRKRAGHVLSLPFESILALEKALPGTHDFFGTFDGNKMIAAAITLKVQPDILYVYAWGDAEKNEYAPTVQLCECIYLEACFSACRLLDIGIGTLMGAENPGLIAFKESLAFRPSAKVTMRCA